ncbi:hypothetical protein KMC49_gp19 [Ralstonia phage Firinga]|uniref:Uncharacterized protein n=3 Tax=Firingavirus TaxID=2843381 RepID=A0A7G5B9W4_9CAUD|nr:hypothetical protein X532_gp08 [Ralstonia phage RSK1]YP_010078558.1 hypothetical protein KMC49_gp19 [Ralstonia phage Firinga]QMV33087.1 hypothetical protein 18C_00019 [Ralstonia phage Firinga]QMV33319.1 hypothetical protein 12C_00009 [Ralstonia phage Hennie]BAO04673.1 hypothetical protein [Ralstonia phage RSK1]
MNINQLSQDSQIQTSDLIAIWSQGNGQPRQASLSQLLSLLQSGFTFSSGGLLLAASLYALRRTTAETLALTTTPAIVTPYDANGNSVLNSGGQSLTQNVTTGLMQATRAIKGCQFWVALVGSLPSPRVLTLQLQTGPVGGPLFTSEFEAIVTGTGANQCYTFSGILQNPNNVNSQINLGDIIQLVASADAATTLSISRASLIVQPLDGV